MISVDTRLTRGSFQLDAKFETTSPVTVLFGPSGSGKTTIINLIAGLLRPDEGRISLNGAVLNETESRTFVPPHRRRIGLVFQDAQLFPHMTVEQNLNFGRWFADIDRSAPETAHIVETLGLGHLLKRRPSTLSGGERQRTALGRALLSSPQLLLMDEPLASLDDERKQEILPLIERMRDEFKTPILYVTHDRAEVERLADAIVTLDKGVARIKA